MVGIAIMSPSLLSVYTVLVITMEESDWSISATCLLSGKTLRSSSTLLRGTVIVLIPIKGKACDASKWNFLIVLREGGHITEPYKYFGLIFHLWDCY